MKIASAAIAYWAVVFALGFVLGSIRVLWLVPQVGLLPATAIELPVMLLASWFAAGGLLRRYRITRRSQGLAMGCLAFALLAAEMALAAALTGDAPGQWIARQRQPHALLGLAGQVAFALLPWWRAGRSG